MTPSEKFEQFVKENDISIKYQFIPFSLSRNSEEKHKSLNWKVTLSSSRGKMTFDYSKGIGHLPYPQTYFMKITADKKKSFDNAIISATEKGIAPEITNKNGELQFGIKQAKFPNPTIQEVLESLTIDAQVKDYISFDNWAADFGFNNDSITAEKIYKSCQKTAQELSKILGGSDKIDYVRTTLYEMENEDLKKITKLKNGI